MTVQQLFKDQRLNISAISRDIGINPSLMRQYACGDKKPSTKQIKRIQQGVDKLEKFLSGVKLES